MTPKMTKHLWELSGVLPVSSPKIAAWLQHKCVYFYEDRDASYKYFLIIMQADIRLFAFYFINKYSAHERTCRSDGNSRRLW